ncbi:MAG TPA: GNAT family N-acetyltransferase [Streptosporangiaceae bacterium]
MQILPVDLDDTSAVDRCYQIVAAGEQLDLPGQPPQPRARFAAWLSGFGEPRRLWLAHSADGGPVGCCVLGLPTRENVTMAECLIAVVPEQRRSGYGTRLLAHCVAEARAAGRSRLVGEAIDGSPGATFAADSGSRPGIGFEFRELMINPEDQAFRSQLTQLRADAIRLAAGYAPVSWVGSTPDEYMEDSVRLSAAMVDMPSDAGVEVPIWDAGRIRAFEEGILSSGRTLYTVAARHEASGSIVAITQVTTDEVPGGAAGQNPSAHQGLWARQGITAVLPEHRGHRLGVLVKVEMADVLMRLVPDLRHILTRNAEANEHMVAINVQLGYQIRSVRRDWELEVPG